MTTEAMEFHETVFEAPVSPSQANRLAGSFGLPADLLEPARQRLSWIALAFALVVGVGFLITVSFGNLLLQVTQISPRSFERSIILTLGRSRRLRPGGINTDPRPRWAHPERSVYSILDAPNGDAIDDIAAATVQSAVIVGQGVDQRLDRERLL